LVDGIGGELAAEGGILADAKAEAKIEHDRVRSARR